MKTNKGKCVLCKDKTVMKLNGHRICSPCYGKYGSWVEVNKKLNSIGINCRIKEDNQIEPKKERCLLND